jgi:ketosteroid isomerase-like protein
MPSGIRRPGDLQARAPDHALGHGDDDVALVRRWFQHLQLHVQAVDFVGARSLFAEEIVTFGTVRAFTVGREATEREQWRNVWSRIDGFRWQLDDLRVLIAGDRRTAVGMALFDSIGYAEDGTPYDRPGRSTLMTIVLSPMHCGVRPRPHKGRGGAGSTAVIVFGSATLVHEGQHGGEQVVSWTCDCSHGLFRP